jgi:hypothetical protein
MSKIHVWSARIMMGIVVLFMLFDSISKLFKQADSVNSTLELGYSEDHIFIIAILALISTILYAIPRTSFLGALLLTAYYGGVVASQIRMDNPLFSNILFSVYLAILVWGSLWLIDERIRKLVPFRQ